MTNPFHANELLKSLSNYPVRKGDVEGHAFHGNQYSSARDAIKGKIDELADRHTPENLDKGTNFGAPRTYGELINHFKGVSDDHRRIADDARTKLGIKASSANPTNFKHLLAGAAADKAVFHLNNELAGRPASTPLPDRFSPEAEGAIKESFDATKDASIWGRP